MTLLCLFGAPGSGKTTLATRIAAEVESKVFSFDRMLDEPSSSASYHDFRKRCQDDVCAYLEVNREGIRSNRSLVIIDDVLYLKSMRRPFRRMANRYALNFAAIHVQCPLDECLVRNNRREGVHRVDELTVQRVYGLIETTSDGYQYDGDFQRLVGFLKALPIMELPTQAAFTNVEDDDDPVTCKIDVITREAVAKLRSNVDRFDGRLASRLRRDLVNEFKHTEVTLEQIFEILIDRYREALHNR